MQIALAWLLQRSPKILTIPGTSSVKHLNENLGAPELRLSKDEYNELANVQELIFSR
jgi:aryl-alcohol dehydrogenase-like predicted oxidoreductase